MIKKTFLAVAVGAALGSVGANAAPTFTFDVNDWTTEGATDVTSFAVPDINVALGTEYTPNDVIEFTFSQAVAGDFLATVNVKQPDNAACTAITGGTYTGADFTMTLGLIDQTATTVKYRVTELTPDVNTGSGVASTNGACFTLTSEGSSDITVLKSATGYGVGAAGLTAEYTATTADTGLRFDDTATPVSVVSGTDTNMLSFVDQYATVAASASFNNTIDIEPGVGTVTRSVFTTGNGMDSATVSVTESGTATHDALTSGLTVTLSGDFSFLVDAIPGTPALDLAAGALYAELNSGSVVQASMTDASTAVFEWDNSGSDTTPLALGNVGMHFNNALNGTGQKIEPGSFSVSVDIEHKPADATYTGENGSQTYDVAGNEDTAAEGSTAVGSWGLNGSSVTVYAAPVYDGITETFLWVTNDSADVAPVQITAVTSAGTSVDLNDAADTTAPMSVSLAANSITRISAELAAALDGAGIENDRVTLVVTTSAPACNVNVAASYKHVGDADRLALETSQTIQGVHNTGNSGTTDDLCAL